MFNFNFSIICNFNYNDLICEIFVLSPITKKIWNKETKNYKYNRINTTVTMFYILGVGYVL